ncbi:MAG: hypothetical protein K2P59_03180 [Acetatifactor sp.]|nr:hypothetical protein [Acetatifactor sp.]
MDQSMIFNFFGGVSQDLFGWAVDYDKVLYELTRWLLPICICLLAEGICLEKWRKIEPLTCYRHETVKMWWRQKYVKSLLNGLSAAAVLFIAAAAVDQLSGVGLSGEVWKVLILWLPHILTILSFFLVLDLTGLRRLAPAILLLLEGFTFLLGFTHVGAARFMYGMWGMYFQSKWYYGETGVSVLTSLITEGILLVFGYLTGRLLLEKTARNR